MLKTSQAQPAYWFHYGFLLFAAAFLYLNLFMLPATPVFDPEFDQGFYLHNATRMLDGQIIYRDFFQFTPPGTELVYFCLFKLFGVHAWIPNATVVVLGLGIVWLCVFISSKLLNGMSVYLSSFLILVLSLHPVLDGSHHWFSMLAVLAAVALIIERRSISRLAASAALCALASFFTQTRGLGAVAAIALFLWWEDRKTQGNGRTLLKKECVLVAVFAVVTLALNLYFVWQAGLKRYLWCTIVFVLKYYPKESELNSFHLWMLRPPVFNHWRFVPDPGWLIVYALIPLIYLIAFLHCWRQSEIKPDQPWDRLLLLALVGFFLFLGIAPAPVVWRMCIVSPPGFILLVWYLCSSVRMQTISKWAMCGGSIAAMFAIVWSQQTSWHVNLETPAGPAAFFRPDVYATYKWLSLHTHPSDPFFDCSGRAYFLLKLESPAQVSFLSGTDYMRPEQVQDLVESLERRRVHVVLWCSDLDAFIQPGDHLGPLRNYLRSHYHALKNPEVPESAGILVRDTSATAE